MTEVFPRPTQNLQGTLHYRLREKNMNKPIVRFDPYDYDYDDYDMTTE
jgi:hypothetical protein